MFDRRLKSYVDNALSQFPAVALLGPRQSGKTTLAQEWASKSSSVYLDLELPSDAAKLVDAESYLTSVAGRLVIIDEVQRAPHLFPILRALIDQQRRKGHRAGQYLLLGSASGELLARSSESLAGRVAYLELTPLLLNEVFATQQPAARDKLWIRGGFPDSFLAPDERASLAWRQSFLRTFLERDVLSFTPRLASTTLRRLWTMLAHDQGSILNASRLAQSLGVSATSVTRYIDLLCDLLLVRRLHPAVATISKRLTRSPKVYVRDAGLCHALLGLSSLEDVLSHPVAGGSWEGFVIEQILATLPGGWDFGFFRTQVGAEIDLVLTQPGGERWAIEVKRSSAPTVTRGFYLACEDLEVSKAWVVYPGLSCYPLEKNAQVIGLEAFLDILQR